MKFNENEKKFNGISTTMMSRRYQILHSWIVFYLILTFTSLPVLCYAGRQTEHVSQDSTIGSSAEIQETTIDINYSANVTAMAGHTAILKCRVHRLKNHTVDWVRQRDLHVLTVGRYSYTNDDRFQSRHEKNNDDWLLQISFVQPSDSGAYECQVSTSPMTVIHTVHLKVTQPVTYIVGGPDIYIREGSTLNLTCVVEFSREIPDFIFWNHNGKIMNYLSERRGLSIIVKKGEHTSSSLLLHNVAITDSGHYECKPLNSADTSINVHVIPGEITTEIPDGGQDENVSSRVENVIGLLLKLRLFLEYLF